MMVLIIRTGGRLTEYIYLDGVLRLLSVVIILHHNYEVQRVRLPYLDIELIIGKSERKLQVVELRTSWLT